MSESRRNAYRDQLRLSELGLVMRVMSKLVAPGVSVLEIGAGTGAQSRMLSEGGYSVSAVDLPGSTYATERVHSIVDYDGVNLPFSDSSFDIVFSSNVMEHVEQFDQLQDDISRVLKSDGVCLHVIPNSFWVVFTFFGYWITIPREVWRLFRKRTARRKEKEGEIAEVRTKRHRTGRSAIGSRLFPSAHGVMSKYMLPELWLFSKRNWLKRFSSTGWVVKETGRVGLFYTGHEIFGPRISFRAREWLSLILRGSCTYYVLERESDTGNGLT